MNLRDFAKALPRISAGVMAGALLSLDVGAQPATQPDVSEQPIRIVMGGYGQSTTSFSQALKLIGNRLEAKFGDDVEVRYVYNVTDLGYTGGGDLQRLVNSGALALAYRTMAEGIPALELTALPFVFSDLNAARAAMDGSLGQAAIETIEAQTSLRVLGFFENGFRHVSNSVRPVRMPADLSGLKIRSLSINARAFELFGAKPTTISLAEALPHLEAGTIDGQENPFENTVSYNPYLYQRFHTATYHSYLSRPIFVDRLTFDSWPEALQSEMRAAVADAVIRQRALHDEAEVESVAIIREAGGEIVELTPEQRAAFIAAVAPMYAEARTRYTRELLELVGL